MGGKSKLWLLSAALIAAGAALEAAAVALYWRPCAGSMLNGSILRGYRYESEFTAGCLTAMDQAPTFALPQPGAGWSLVGSLGAAAGILLAGAWLVLLPSLRVPGMVRLVAALPGLLGITLVINAVGLSLGPASDDDGPGALALLSEASALLALVALGKAGVEGLLLARSAVVALVATSTGLFHQMIEYLAATVLGDANWDVPPGSGYFTVIVCLQAAIATAVLWWLESHETPMPSAAPAGASPSIA